MAASYRQLGSSLTSAGRRQEAEQVFRQGLELDPDRPELLDELARLLAGRPKTPPHDPARAVGLAKRAVEASPKNGDFWNTLGVAHYRAGDWTAAAKALQKATQLRDGGNASDWFFLAMAHWHRGDPSQARDCYERARAWLKEHPKRAPEFRRVQDEATSLLGVSSPPSPGGGQSRP